MKKMHKILATFFACTIPFSLCACGDDNNDGLSHNATYTIQYTDETGIHTVDVQSGKLYSISSIPQKNGYDFMGLYDAEVGGTQYINAGGSAVAVYMDNKDIVLYPQFRAKEYTLILDYQGAAVTGSRSMRVAYDSEISELPLNLTLENKNFVGWYTEPNRNGNQIADQYGVLPENRKVTEKLFDLSDPDGNIKLYAGFKGEEFTVTFYLTESSAPEEIKVEYGTPISEVQLETRVDGKAVLVWSKKRNDVDKEQAFTGKVTSEMVLYAAEFAPVIDFDSNGGNNINSIIARAGDAINLPTPSRENYKFVGWQAVGGSIYNVTTMPVESTKLTAKWRAMIIFDTNGGTDVTNISEPQGTRISLPETEKAGYIFAGWYDGNGDQYTVTAMPSISIRLYAKFWKVLKEMKVIISESTSKNVYNSLPTVDNNSYYESIDLSKLYNNGVRQIKVVVHYDSCGSSKATAASPDITYTAWYSQKITSDAYKIWSYEDKHTNNGFETYVRNTELYLTSSTIYICFYGYRSGYYMTFTNFYIEIEYPDMSTLY